ncbi:hypothetical protein DAEQUDRAFT_736504 [Daedalea quercina L-15889]|uniref:Peptidase C14 caspase domain-containing protein n=1 Tax=Daedalea quercina L-15889 TaxID=1314783 RepID=A0A165S7R4_9APHY|nr:hypothetical protein DAEQUDRAFT_736504 [Daedalea quercina L-15889]
MKTILKAIKKKVGSKDEPTQVKQPDDRAEAQIATTPSSAEGKAVDLPSPSASNPTDTGTTLAPPVVAKVPSDASSSKSGAKTPSPEEEAAKVEGLVQLDTKCAESRIWALVIAINSYPTAPLNGCVADGQAMVEFLKTKLHVPTSQLATLFDEAASREAVLSTFRRHLSENDAINKGDGIIFFFAGHGTQEHAPDEEDWGLDGDIVECICPQDLNWTSVHGIPSTTLNGLFRELASVKGDNITAIFDCCHSGKITRKDRGLRYMTPPRNFKPVLPPATDADVRKWWPGRNQSSRAAKGVVPVGFRYDSLRSHVLLSACRAEEEAMERIIEGTRAVRGFFTSTLLEVLDEHEGSTAGLTYAYLFDELLPSKPFQHPQCLGKHKNRLLWNTTIKIVDGFRITVREGDGAIVVHAGRVHGIAPRTTFTVQARGEADRNLGTLAVLALQDLECVCEYEGAPFEVATGARAVVKEWNNEDLTLDVFVDPGVTGKHTELGHPAIPLLLAERVPAAGAPDEADLVIVPAAAPGETLVQRRDPLMRELAREIVVDFNKHHINYLVTAALHFNFHLYRQPNPLNVFETVHLELYKLREESAGAKRLVEVADGMNYFDRERKVEAYKAHGPVVVQEAVLTDLKPFYGVKIVNDSDCNLFPYLFYFDPTNYGIQCWYQPESPSMAAPLRAHSSLKVGYGARAVESSIQFSVPPGQASDTGFLKMFVATSYVDMELVVQGGFDGWRVARLQRAVEQRELWSACTYILTCQSPHAR